MVDFKNRVKGVSKKQPLEPAVIYDGLDRASDKGPLRPAQDAVLKEWHEKRRKSRDVIVKLHTGQGKTLIGLLILQSKLNENCGPAVYLCPDAFLVEQTCLQAHQFGIAYCTAPATSELPDDFLNSKSILICTVHKLFNGLTKFGLHAKSVEVAAIVIDDAHACIEAIRDASAISLSADSAAYKELRGLFASGLESQGHGTYADLVNGSYESLLPVPYWDWIDRSSEIAKLLSKHSDSKAIKFGWPLIRDVLEDCECLVSGQSLEIHPRLPPLEAFGSYSKAKHRLFMSATISDDSFLVKGLGLSADTVEKPLTYAQEKWSGEKMVLVPSLIAQELSRDVMIKMLGPKSRGRPYGVVALVPSFKVANDWKNAGAVVADKNSIDSAVAELRNGNFDSSLVVANRYDGIDLPDQSCRILVLDSRPYGESLYERHLESCLPGSDAVAIRIARTIEQGMGRSVRGEKDYSVVMLVGAELVRIIRAQAYRKFLSPQTRKQVEIGLNVASFAQEDLEKGSKPKDVLDGLVGQCLKRDPGWKTYYVEQMNELTESSTPPKRLAEFASELEAERLAHTQKYEEAAQVAQELADKAQSPAEKGWYIQESARHLYRASKVESEKRQAAAHDRNRYLLRPRVRKGVTRLAVEQRRVEKIIEWIRNHPDPATLMATVGALLAPLRFGVHHDSFEAALDDLGKALGIASERPDKEWKEGPDNLWRVRDNKCLVIECKTEVSTDRKDIAKHEAEQMNQSAGWFSRTYPGVNAEYVVVIPPNVLAADASLAQETVVLQKDGLELLVQNVHQFFMEFFAVDLQTLSTTHVQNALDRHQLGVDDLLSKYTGKIRTR